MTDLDFRSHGRLCGCMGPSRSAQIRKLKIANNLYKPFWIDSAVKMLLRWFASKMQG